MSAASAVRKASRARLLRDWMRAVSIVRLSQVATENESARRAYVQGTLTYAPETVRACLLTAWGM